VETEIVLITTQGDHKQAEPIESLGAQGIFTKELERAALDGRIDVAVHSLKDLPTSLADGLILAAIPKRGPDSDVLVTRSGKRLVELPTGGIVGTGSLRRRAQLRRARRDLVMHDIRGNVETRIAKMEEGLFDAIVLAEAGLDRLGLLERVAEVLPRSIMMPAVGQGALGLQIREEDERARQCLLPLDDRDTHQAVTAERSFLDAVRGGCLAPIGAHGRVEGDGLLHLDAVVLSRDGGQRIEAMHAGPPNAAVEIGWRVADDMLRQGAAELIRQSREP
jgi:hydroxymethylbilane synthase